jgi:uncharacterized protein
VTILLTLLAFILVFAGIAGTVLPVLPGTPLVFLGLLVAAKLDHFRHVGGKTIAVLALLTILSYLIDLIAVYFGVRSVDASRKALLGASIGMAIGIFMGLPGLILAPLMGAFIGEWLTRRDLIRAGQVSVATGLGLLVGTASRMALAFTMVGFFLIVYFWR